MIFPDDDSDGDYFEIGPDGKIRLKAGKKKIDISKLSEEQLRQLGIDLKTMSKEEIAKILKVRKRNEFKDGINLNLKVK